MKRAAIRIASARRPLARTFGYQACSWGCVGGLGVSTRLFVPTGGAVVLSVSTIFFITLAAGRLLKRRATS